MTIEKNLFSYATSELSQDALLAYMFKNHESNGEVIDRFLDKVGLSHIKAKYISDVSVYQQFSNKKLSDDKLKRMKIDLIITIELKNTTDKYLLVIEDKVKSNAGENQLANYEKIINSDDSFKKYKNIVFIYYKLDYPFTEIIENDKYRLLYIFLIHRVTCWQ